MTSYDKVYSYIQSLRRQADARRNETYRCINLIEEAAVSADDPKTALALLNVAAVILTSKDML